MDFKRAGIFFAHTPYVRHEKPAEKNLTTRTVIWMTTFGVLATLLAKVFLDLALG